MHRLTALSGISKVPANVPQEGPFRAALGSRFQDGVFERVLEFVLGQVGREIIRRIRYGFLREILGCIY